MLPIVTSNNMSSTSSCGIFSRLPCKIPHITVSSQNCNSLNISTDCDRQLSKIVALTSLGTSIIFLSDLRLGGRLEHVDKISKLFLTNSTKSYNFFIIHQRIVGVWVY
jgi:hypothetical protein